MDGCLEDEHEGSGLRRGETWVGVAVGKRDRVYFRVVSQGVEDRLRPHPRPVRPGPGGFCGLGFWMN